MKKLQQLAVLLEDMIGPDGANFEATAAIGDESHRWISDSKLGNHLALSIEYGELHIRACNSHDFMLWQQTVNFNSVPFAIVAVAITTAWTNITAKE